MTVIDREGPFYIRSHRDVLTYIGWTEPMNQMILWTESETEKKRDIILCMLLNLKSFVCSNDTVRIVNALFDCTVVDPKTVFFKFIADLPKLTAGCRLAVNHVNCKTHGTRHISTDGVTYYAVTNILIREKLYCWQLRVTGEHLVAFHTVSPHP